MSETYCGKSCIDCAYAEQLHCPGCNCGQYSPVSAQCAIATCCRSKGHQTCDTCGFSSTCITLPKKERIPDQILEKQAMLVKQQEARLEARERTLQSAAFLGKWLWPLFWLLVPGILGNLLSSEDLGGNRPVLYAIGMVLTAVASLAYGWILLKLAPENDRYRTAGICILLSAGASLLVELFFGSDVPGWTLLFTLPSLIAKFVGEYQEYTAHAEVLEGVHDTQAQQWYKLWKWYIGAFAGIFGSILVLLISPVLGLIVLLAALITLITVSILKLVYLYRTAKFFRELANTQQAGEAL